MLIVNVYSKNVKPEYDLYLFKIRIDTPTLSRLTYNNSV